MDFNLIDLKMLLIWVRAKLGLALLVMLLPTVAWAQASSKPGSGGSGGGGSANTPTGIVFEGATDDAFETTLAITDPTTPDKTITFPNATGTVALLQQSNIWTANQLFEGATANAFTTTFAITDPTTPSKVITFPDLTGTVALLGVANASGLTVPELIVGAASLDDAGSGTLRLNNPGSGLVSLLVRTQTGDFVFADDAGQPTFRDDQGSNGIDLGASASLFRNLYLGTTLFTPLVRSAADADLTIQAIGTTGEMLFNATEGYYWGFDGAAGDVFGLRLSELAPDLPAIYPDATGSVDLGAASKEFNDIYIAGVVTVDGDEGIDGSGTCVITEIKGGIITGANCT